MGRRHYLCADGQGPRAKGFVYLIAILDWYTRRVLAWRVSNSLTADFCVVALQEGLGHYGCSDIFNTDQGSQFTCSAFIEVLTSQRIQISTDGQGRWRGNVMVERLWKTVKYEEIYLHDYDTVSAVKAGIGRYLEFYNTQRPRTALDGRTPR